MTVTVFALAVNEQRMAGSTIDRMCGIVVVHWLGNNCNRNRRAYTQSCSIIIRKMINEHLISSTTTDRNFVFRQR